LQHHGPEQVSYTSSPAASKASAIAEADNLVWQKKSHGIRAGNYFRSMPPLEFAAPRREADAEACQVSLAPLVQ
jgi:hypothetical protein